MPTPRYLPPVPPRIAAFLFVFVSFPLARHAFADDPPPADKAAPTAFNAPQPTPSPGWGVGDARSFWVPALEIPAYEILLNRFDHYEEDAATYPSMWTNLRVNQHRSWVIDNDKFSTNQFL